ncbi:MAG: hypothetical protein ACFCUJ_14270 [Thiotrichales bacterium]
MKKILSMAIVCGSFAGFANAEAACQQPGAVDAAPATEMFKHRFGVDDEQARQMQAIMEEQREKHRAMHEKHMQEMEQYRAETEARMKSVLNEDQLKRMEELRARRDAMRGGAGPQSEVPPSMPPRAHGPYRQPRAMPEMVPPVPGPWIAPRFPRPGE